MRLLMFKSILFPINLISILRNFYWFIGYEYYMRYSTSPLFQYNKLNYFGINFIKFFNFRLVFLFFIFYFYIIGLDEEIVLAFLIVIFGYYFYKFVFCSLITYLEFEIISVKNLILNSFVLYENFLINLSTLLHLFKVFSKLLNNIFVSIYITFLSFLILSFTSQNFDYLKNFKNILNNLLKLESKSLFTYYYSSLFQLPSINSLVIGQKILDIKTDTGLNSTLHVNWYSYYWLSLNWNYNFLYFNVF